MDDVEDEKKRFDPEVPQEEDSQPDPEEELMLDRGSGRVWLVKVSTNPIQPKRSIILLPHFKRYPST